MNNRTIQELIEWCKYCLFEDSKEFQNAHFIINPSTEPCLKNIKINEFNVKLKPFKMKAYSIKDTLIEGNSWAIYKEETK